MPGESPRPDRKGKMADPSNPQSCLRWIKDEEMVHRTESYGENKRSVLDALEDQQHRDKLVQDFQGTVDKVRQEHKEEIQTSYESLKTVSEKKLGCLQDIAQIAGLEDLMGALSSEFAEKASSLVATECSRSVELPTGDGCGVQAQAQSCILAVRSNWAWISKLVKCTDTHLQHSSQFHQFYHEVAEYRHWMPLHLRSAVNKVALKEDAEGTNIEAMRLLIELKELLSVFLHWAGKLEVLFSTSKTLHPVHLRAKKVQYFRPVSALCDYKTHDIQVREGEELLLIDNADTQSWQVRTLNAVESRVPSVICVIPGPDPEAVQTALKLRLEFLYVWTENVKRIGKDLILFMILILRDWTDEEIKIIRSMRPEDKQVLRSVLTGILGKLAPCWEGFSGYEEFKSRVEILLEILEGDGSAQDRDDEFSLALVESVKTTDDVLSRYDDYWRQWDTYRILMETCKHADYMLLTDKLEQLKFLSIEELRKMWQAGLLFGDGDNESFESWLRKQKTRWDESSSMTQTSSSMLQCESVDGLGSSGSNGYEHAEVTTMDRQYETASTSTFTSTEQEEKKTFVITGVVDPKSGDEVSMHQAVMMGIIDSTNGTYNDARTGTSLPIPVAMSQGFIKVEFTTTKKSAEKRHDIGLITLKTHKESRPYSVKSVVDAKTDQHLTVDDAIRKGILDQQNSVYVNPVDGVSMSLADALDSGLLIVEFDTDAEVLAPEVVTKTYAIHAVVDQRKKAKVSFSEAVKDKLLDKDTGAYYHNVNKEHIYVGDAIRKGFIKATVVQDPNSLDIDPENRMVVEKVQSIRRKLLNPMRALAAMKKAAAAAELNGQ